MNDKKRNGKARPATPIARFRRFKRRLYRRHPQARRAVNIATAALCLLIAVGGVSLLVISALPKAQAPNAPRPEVAAPAMDELALATRGQATLAATDPSTPESTETVDPLTPEPTPEPTATLAPAPEAAEKPSDGLELSVYRQAAAPGTDYANPTSNKLLSMTKVYEDARSEGIFDTDEDDIHMGASSEYAKLEGVTTFRGSNYRDGGAYGAIPDDPSKLLVAWRKRIRGIDEWTGVGWTGQGSIVRWPADLRAKMNIVRAKKEKDGLTEVIYATLDGHSYFLDLDDGQETRSAINIGAPIKGSLTVDPRGVPL